MGEPTFRPDAVQPVEKDVETLETLTAKLTAAGIDLSQWGQGGNKGVEDLLKEIQAGEATLVEREGKLMRQTRIAKVRVEYVTPGGRRLTLKETMQVFKKDGAKKSRNNIGLSEKLVAGEDPLAGALRGLQEELQVQGEAEVQLTETVIESGNPKTAYPGLLTEYEVNRLAVQLTPDQYRAEGYVEDDGKKTTHFEWEEVKG